MIRLIKFFLTQLKYIFSKQNMIPATPPENRPGFPELQLNSEGLEKCVACGLCAFSCPVEIIDVQAARNPEDKPISAGDAYARSFTIEIARCISCGSCEEACVPGAIELSGREISPVDNPQKLNWNKEQLLADD